MDKPTLKERRLARLAEQKRGNPTEERIKTLVRQITTEMYMDALIDDIEEELVSKGKMFLEPSDIILSKETDVFKALSKVKLQPSDSSSFFEKFTIFTTANDSSGVDIVKVSPAWDFFKKNIKPYLEAREIEVECVTAALTWYKVKLTIEGVSE